MSNIKINTLEVEKPQKQPKVKNFLKAIFVNNFWLKASAIVLAFVVWFLVSSLT